MNRDTDWVDTFLANLRYTARRLGRPDVKLAADLTGEHRSLIYRVRSTERGRRLREEWDLIVSKGQRQR